MTVMLSFLNNKYAPSISIFIETSILCDCQIKHLIQLLVSLDLN